jgi:hypothetical protein
MEKRPPQPEVICGTLPQTGAEQVDLLGIGGMFAYLNVLYQAHKHGGKHCIVTNPRDIFTFSGWTLHPEEDMDQRLIEMFETKTLALNEMKRLAGLAHGPESNRYKAFRLDYQDILLLAKENPKELIKNTKVSLQYAALELTDVEKSFARTNLERNAATIKALEEMGRIGSNPEHDIVNMCSRVVFEVEGEAKGEWKSRLKEQFGLLGEAISLEEIRTIYGADLDILNDIRAGNISAIKYPGGHFLTGHKYNALQAAREKDLVVFNNAIATKIIIDLEARKYAVSIKLGDGGQTIVTANVLLLALGDYAENVITVDGVSALFAVVTDNSEYRIYPTGMGEGGTIHIVPVWSYPLEQGGKKIFYHLGKATNGAIMGRNPSLPKSVHRDKALLTHLETNLKKIAPLNSTFIWIAVTECGRPVSARQGYTIEPLRLRKGWTSGAQPAAPLSFKATGGCGLGGNTAIIPEVQEILDRRAAGIIQPKA